jgi:predicted permease
VTEIRLAIRRLLARPTATLGSILTLTLAIGAATATWSVLSAVLLRPLPVRGADRLAKVGVLSGIGSSTPTTQSDLSYREYEPIATSGAFEATAAAWLSPISAPVGTQKPPESTPLLFASHTLFDVLGLRMPLGRGFVAADDRREAPMVAILSDRYWRTAFDADPRVIGRVLPVGGQDVTIIGVAPRGFRGLSLAQAPALFLPLETIARLGSPLTNYLADPRHQSSPTWGLGVIGRLRDGDTFEQARARLASLGPLPGARSSVPLRWYVIDISTAALPALTREGTRQFGRLMATTVVLLVVIGCSTVGLLLLVRTEARREEFATCLALGATRFQIARGVVLEGALLALAAASLSPLVTWWLFSILGTFQLPGGITLGLLDLSIDRRALAVIVGAAAAATFSIAAIAGSLGFGANIADALRARAGATPRRARRRTRAVLLATQVAVAFVLVAGTGVLVRSLLAALDLNRGLGGARVVTTNPLQLSGYGYTPERAATLFDEIRQRLADNPAVPSVSTFVSEGGMGAGGRLIIDGAPRVFPTFVAFREVDSNYFHTVGMRILRGRHFSTGDVVGSPRAGIVSESFARMIGSGEDVLGRHIVVTYGGKLDITIVGVVDDLFTNIRDAEPLGLYLPLAQRTFPAVDRTLAFRAAGDVEAARREVTNVVRQLDPSIRMPPSLTLDERLMALMAPQQFGAWVLGSLGSIALLLTMLGTYVLAETMAVMRMRELGIRAALGATTSSLAWLVVRESAALVGLGLGAGLLLSWLGANTIRGFLLQVQPLDPVTLGSVAMMILLVTIATSLRPALRAGRLDVSRVLRAE